MNQDGKGRRAAFVVGASSGIGQAIALALAREGFDLAISATRRENLAELSEKLRQSGARFLPVELDLRSSASIARAAKAAAETFSDLDVLVNNAGLPLRKAAIDITLEEWNAVLEINLTGAFFVAQKFGKRLIEQGKPGCIVNLASTYGVVGFPDRSAYGVAKAGVIQMTRMLAIEWAQHGVRVNAVAPGTVATPSRQALLADPKTRETLLNRVPLRRFTTAEEVAGAVLYLVSPAAANVTGQTLLLDGGLTAY